MADSAQHPPPPPGAGVGLDAEGPPLLPSVGSRARVSSYLKGLSTGVNLLLSQKEATKGSAIGTSANIESTETKGFATTGGDAFERRSNQRRLKVDPTVISLGSSLVPFYFFFKALSQSIGTSPRNRALRSCIPMFPLLPLDASHVGLAEKGSDNQLTTLHPKEERMGGAAAGGGGAMRRGSHHGDAGDGGATPRSARRHTTAGDWGGAPPDPLPPNASTL